MVILHSLNQMSSLYSLENLRRQLRHRAVDLQNRLDDNQGQADYQCVALADTMIQTLVSKFLHGSAAMLNHPFIG